MLGTLRWKSRGPAMAAGGTTLNFEASKSKSGARNLRNWRLQCGAVLGVEFAWPFSCAFVLGDPLGEVEDFRPLRNPATSANFSGSDPVVGIFRGGRPNSP